MQKALTIQKVNEADITKFHEIRNEKGLTPAACFSSLVNNTQPQVNAVNTDSLKEKIAELEASLQSLQQINDSLQADKLSLQTSLQEAEKKQASLLAITEEQNNEINELKNSPIEVKVPIQLGENEFVCSPSEEVLKLSRKYRPFLKKDGVFTGSDSEYPNFLFNTAVTKYIKNKYE